MKLTDFYDVKKIPVTSVNSKTGDVKLNASDVNAIDYNQIGIAVPKLVNGIVPDSQLPPYAKLVNGKIVYSNLPLATKYNVGALQIGDGFEEKGNGVIDAIGIVSKQQKRQKIDIIQTEGNGNKLLTDNGTYINIGNQLKSSFKFDRMNQDYTVIFQNNLPIVGVKSNNGNYYTVNDQVNFYDQYTILNMRRFLIQQNENNLNGFWIVYFSCTKLQPQIYNRVPQNYKTASLKNSLIYG